MDIGLVSGVEANTEDLSTASIQEWFFPYWLYMTELQYLLFFIFFCALQLASGVDQLIADYEIKDGHVLVQIDSVCYPFPDCKHCFYSLESFGLL